MRKILFYGFLLFIFVMLVKLFVGSVQTSRYKPVQAQAITINTEYPIATSTPQPTFTIVPSATIDYQQTAIVAQSTADEARRINSMATAEYVRLINEQLAMTQVVEQQNFVIQSWTITAALTTIPLTATQQAVINTQIPQQQQIIAAQMTATKEGPAQLVAMRDAENRVKYGKLTYIANIVAALAIFVFAIGVVVFVFRFPMVKRDATQEHDDEQPTSENVTRINLYTDNGTHSELHDVPCSSDQLSEFAEKFLEGVTLRINNWEGSNTLWTRDVYEPFRDWMEKVKLVEVDIKPNGSKQLTPKPELSVFLRHWLDRGVLPAGYEFKPTHSPETRESPDHAENTTENLMLMSSHAKNNGGGGANPVLAVGDSK